MGALKLRDIGTSQGFVIPKSELLKAGFSKDDEFEILVKENSISILKRRPHHSKWTFPEPKIPDDESAWVDTDLGENQ
jgi:antitoxin component of MazEF toxin-antitoxin module